MRHPFIAANWKMHKTVHESVVFVKEFRSMVKDFDDVEIVVAPPFTAVHAVAEAARNSNVGVSGQNLHWERQGAFTGEVSAAMIKDVGAGVITATSQQYPLKMAAMGVEAGVEYAKTGKKPSGYTDTGVTLIAAKPLPGVDSKDVKAGTELCWGKK